MENTIMKETADIFKQLTPENQSYFITLIRVAEAAENGVKKQYSNLIP